MGERSEEAEVSVSKGKSNVFRPATAADRVDYPTLEATIQKWWDDKGVLRMYLQRNEHSDKQFSFLDGPITANNPMGVHHAWGRAYKDLYQRFKTMQGYKQHYQNGFDCQGLWVEVEVEKDLGMKTKRDIEAYGIDAFVERCKERVFTFAKRQTEQSIRLGYWMDWGNDYYTLSDENNYTIWSFLKRCHERGLLYKGRDVMPWCPRCATGISNMEMESEGYKETSHLSLYVRLPLVKEGSVYRAERSGADIAMGKGYREGPAILQHCAVSYLVVVPLPTLSLKHACVVPFLSYKRMVLPKPVRRP